MERRIQYGIFLLLSLIIGLTLYGLFFRSTSDPVVLTHADARVGARDLAVAFDSQGDLSDSLYLYKVLSVSGVLKKIRKDPSGNYTAFLGDRSSTTAFVSCHLDSLYNHKHLSLKTGDSITIRGTCANHLTDVILLQCIIEKQ
ncbi:MAG TPA: hypothetical protein VGM30_16425 [Puia sp.]|jgi:hypothetical protein